MRRGIAWAVLMMLALTGCATSKPFREMVGYVPPTSLPSQPKRTVIQDRPENVWNNLIASLEKSHFDIDHTDRDKTFIVARYRGAPEGYVDCGSIVIHESGELAQVPAAASDLKLNVELDDRPVVLKRALSLDSRIIIRLQEQNLGTVVSTDTTYMITKTLEVEDSPEVMPIGNDEIVSFSAGRRAEFARGTACQPNGALDDAILQGLPHVIGSNEIDRADLPVDHLEANEAHLPNQSASIDTEYWIDDDQVDAAVNPDIRRFDDR